MQIKQVHFHRNPSYDKNPNRWVGEVQFEEQSNVCTFPLDEEVAEKLLEILTPFMVQFATKAVNDIAAVLTKQIEDNKNPAIDA